MNNNSLYYILGRQPVVTMIESALKNCSEEWKGQNKEMFAKMDLMLELQKQHLELDRQRLEFEREMAGLKKKSTPRKRRKG